MFGLFLLIVWVIDEKELLDALMKYKEFQSEDYGATIGFVRSIEASRFGYSSLVSKS
jgi:hypothetical protein